MTEEDNAPLAPEHRQILMHAHDEIVNLRRRLSELEPKGEAYDAMIAIINRLAPAHSMSVGVDPLWRIKHVLEANDPRAAAIG